MPRFTRFEHPDIYLIIYNPKPRHGFRLVFRVFMYLMTLLRTPRTVQITMS